KPVNSFVPYEIKSMAKITINSDTINAYNVFESEKNKSPLLTNHSSEISFLAYYPSYKFDQFTARINQGKSRFEKFMDNINQEKNRQEAKTEPKLIISAASNEYLITGLSEAEFLWLGKELSEFLDLKLEIIQPTT
ncbi:MAG TPA: hypothetical protein V6C58_24495, partial [Allocoleopsis sp.]